MAKQVPDLLTHFPDLEEDEVPDHTFLWIFLCIQTERRAKY